MADNTIVTSGVATFTAAADEATYSGDTTKVPLARLVHVTGLEGSKVVSELVRLEDAAHTSGDPGIPMLGVRQDTATSLAGTDGDYTLPIFDANGRQHVTGPVTNAGTFAVQAAQSGTWTVQPGNTANTVAWKVDGSAVTQPVSLASVPSHAVTNAGTFAVQAANLENAQGSSTAGQKGPLLMGAVTTAAPTYITTQTSPLSLDTTGALRVVGSSGTTQYAEDAVHASGDSMVFVGALRRDTTPVSSSGTAGDYSAINVDANGRLYVNAALYDAAGAALAASADYTQDAALTIASTAGPATVFRATSAANAAVSADDDAVIGIATLTGKQVVLPYATPAQTWNYAAPAGGLVTTTGVTAKAAGAAGVRHYITSAQVVNSHATVSTEVLINDGAAGTTLHRGWAQAAGGGYAVKFDPPLRGTAATLVEIKEVSATATAGVLVNLQGYSAAE